MENMVIDDISYCETVYERSGKIFFCLIILVR